MTYCSSATPPDNMRTTIAPTRYSPSNAAVTIEIPASRSEPNSRANSLRASSAINGTPPRTNVAQRGKRAAQSGACTFLGARAKEFHDAMNPSGLSAHNG
jgi:hypothetical protein